MSPFSSNIYVKALVLLLFIFSPLCVGAQDTEESSSDPVVTNSFWDNWYGQFGVDMNLLFPHGHSKRDVFPNGKSFGIDAAVGKWFSPEFGGRLKVKWNNGILPNDHAIWLAPYGEPGGNHRDGGFITFIGDVQFNVHNIFGDYKANRTWNMIVAPRAGGWINVGSGAGAHVLGVGLISTYRLNDRWSVYADVGYHFVSSINGVSSGKGHGSNGFGEINVGVEVDLSNHRFYRTSEKDSHESESVKLNPFWSNWFVQAGLGMSLINPYGTNFKNVFPNGETMGINLAVIKSFAPEAAVRLGLNWQNGIIGNHHATYLDPVGETGVNHDKHGYMAVYGDLMFNLHNMIVGYDESRLWNAIFYPRMGVAENFSSSYSECPIVGLGTEHTLRINDRLKLYADVAYQVTTGGFLDARFPTGADASSNGWFDINIGIQYELGKTRAWKKVK